MDEKFKAEKNPTILDVGANIGIFSLSYACIFTEAEIHSFEPVSFIYKDLCQNLQINPKLSKNIHAHNFGFSNFEEKSNLAFQHQSNMRGILTILTTGYLVFTGREKKSLKLNSCQLICGLINSKLNL